MAEGASVGKNLHWEGYVAGLGDKAGHAGDEILVAQSPGGGEPTTQSAAPFKTAEILLVSDAKDIRRDGSGLKNIAPMYARQVLHTDQVKLIGEWKEFVAVLEEYSSVDQLVLAFHGSEGAMAIAEHGKSLRDVAQMFKHDRPKVTQRIDLIGCDIGKEPDQMVALGKAFHAPQVTGWTYSYVIQIARVPKNVLRTDLDTFLKQYKGYLTPRTPNAEELVKGNQVLLAEWFRADESEEPLPPAPPPSEPDLRDHVFKRRNEAVETRIKSEQAAKQGDAYEGPFVPFEHVIVDISY